MSFEVLIDFISCLISTFGIAYFFCKISNTKIVYKRWKAIAFIIMSVITTCLQSDAFKILNFMAYFLFYPMYFKIISKLPFKKIWIYTVLIWVASATFDSFFMLLVTIIFWLFNLKLNMSFFIILATLFLNIIYVYVGNSAKIKKIVIKLVDFFNNVVFMDFVIIIFILFLVFTCYVLFINLRNIKISLTLSFIIILSIFLFVTILNYKLSNYEMKVFLKNLKVNNDLYIKSQDEFRIFRHNLVSELNSIKSVSNKKSSMLIQDVIEKYNTKYSASIIVQQLPYGLNGIIYEKIFPYQNDIKFDIENNVKDDLFDLLKPKKYNLLVEKLGLMMDNAIEACLSSEKRDLKLEININNGVINIKIINTFKGSLNIDKLGNKNYTTKENGNGLGLFSILLTKNIKLDIKIIEDMFISSISLKL